MSNTDCTVTGVLLSGSQEVQGLIRLRPKHILDMLKFQRPNLFFKTKFENSIQIGTYALGLFKHNTELTICDSQALSIAFEPLWPHNKRSSCNTLFPFIRAVSLSDFSLQCPASEGSGLWDVSSFTRAYFTVEIEELVCQAKELLNLKSESHGGLALFWHM